MLQIRVLSPLIINANDFKKIYFSDILLVHLYRPLLPLYWISCSYNGSHDTEGQRPSQKHTFMTENSWFIVTEQNNSKYEWNNEWQALEVIPNVSISVTTWGIGVTMVVSQNGPSWKRPQSKTAQHSVKTAPSEKKIG